MTAALVKEPKYPVETPVGITRCPLETRICCSAVTSAPVEPMVRFCVNVYEPLGVEGTTGALPVREACTFAIVAESAPNDWRSAMIASTCDCVKAAAPAGSATESASARPTTPAASRFDFDIFDNMIINFLTIIISFTKLSNAPRKKCHETESQVSTQ